MHTTVKALYFASLAVQAAALGIPGPRSARQPRPAATGSEVSATVKVLRLAPPGADKLVHAALFAAPTFLGLCAGFSPLLVVGSQLIFAPASELAQEEVVAGRGGALADVAADLAGVALGVAAAAIASRGR